FSGPPEEILFVDDGPGCSVFRSRGRLGVLLNADAGLMKSKKSSVSAGRVQEPVLSGLNGPPDQGADDGLRRVECTGFLARVRTHWKIAAPQNTLFPARPMWLCLFLTGQN